jgi:DNA-directed RNA polymerase subunit RPC12/RpoP
VQDEPLRVRCLACDARLTLPPKADYAACRTCGSEYLVQRRGGAVTLQPITPDELERTRAVAAIEREGEMGCANTALSLLAACVILLCVVGGIGLQFFNSRLICGGAAFVALLLVIVGSVVMRRNLERSRLDRLRLLAEQAAADPPPPAEGGEAETVTPS